MHFVQLLIISWNYSLISLVSIWLHTPGGLDMQLDNVLKRCNFGKYKIKLSHMYNLKRVLNRSLKSSWFPLFVAWISDDYFHSFYPLSSVWIGWPLMPSSDIVVILIGRLCTHLHNECILMRNFSGIVVWYSVKGMLAFYNLYRKQQNCPCLQNWIVKLNYEWRIIAESQLVFHLVQLLCGFGSDFFWAKFYYLSFPLTSVMFLLTFFACFLSSLLVTK